jgi:hypothetical protein
MNDRGVRMNIATGQTDGDRWAAVVRKMHFSRIVPPCRKKPSWNGIWSSSHIATINSRNPTCPTMNCHKTSAPVLFPARILSPLRGNRGNGNIQKQFRCPGQPNWPPFPPHVNRLLPERFRQRKSDSDERYFEISQYLDGQCDPDSVIKRFS